jgi:membrane protein DedA with SNARE-associated domain
MEAIQQLVHWLVDTIDQLGYPGIVLLMAIESSVLPLPSELVMPPAGYLAAQGQMSAWLVVLAGTAGSVLGALANYALAVWLGRPLLHRYGKYFFVPQARLAQAETFFQRHGDVATFTGRLLPGLRHLISLPAGLAAMPMRRFVGYTALGAGLWCSVLTGIGWYLGKSAQSMTPAVIAQYSRKATMYLIPLVLLAVLIHLWRGRGKVVEVGKVRKVGDGGGPA